MHTKDKGNPVPTRFEGPEIDFLKRLSDRTGLSQSELVRRSVRYLRQNVRSPRDYSLLMQLSK